MDMGVIEDLKKLLADPKKKSEFMQQLLKEKELYDKFKEIGLTVASEDVRERARLALGVLTLVEKVTQVDVLLELRKITEIVDMNLVSSAITVNVHEAGTANVSITSSITVDMSIIGATINVPVETAEGAKVDVNIISTITLNVNLHAQTANINVDITAQTVDLNIKTSGGTNLVIDLLEQGAIYERRSTLSNDNGITTPTAPPSSFTGTSGHGKFFSRGCMGFIKNLQIYCKHTGEGKITLAVGISQSIPEIYTVTITPSSSWNWKGLDVFEALKKFWFFDKMLIWVKSIDADVSIGYDEVGDLDYWYSDDNGVTWTEGNNRLFIRVSMKAQTIGDIIPSTINTIAIPTVTTDSTALGVPVPTGVAETSLTKIEGAGVVQRITICISHSAVLFKFYIDGIALKEATLLGQSFAPTYLNEQKYDVSTPQIQLMVYTAEGTCRFNITIPFEFHRSFEVKAFQTTGVEQTAIIGIAYKKLG